MWLSFINVIFVILKYQFSVGYFLLRIVNFPPKPNYRYRQCDVQDAVVVRMR